jgi:hypothetical protein
MSAKQSREIRGLVNNPRWRSDVIRPVTRYLKSIEKKLVNKSIETQSMPTEIDIESIYSYDDTKSPTARQRQTITKKLLGLGVDIQKINKFFDDAKNKHIEKIIANNKIINFKVVAPTREEFISFSNNPHQALVNIEFNVPNSVLYFLYGLFILDYLHDIKRYIPQDGILVYVKQICMTILKNSAIAFFNQAILFANAEIAELTAMVAPPITSIATDLINTPVKKNAMNDLLTRIGACAVGLRDMAAAIIIQPGNNNSLGGNYENTIIHVTQTHFFLGLMNDGGNAEFLSNTGVFSYETEPSELVVYNSVVGTFNNRAIFRSVIKDSGNKYMNDALYCNRDWRLTLTGMQNKSLILSSYQTAEDPPIEGINRKWTDNITIDGNGPFEFYTFPQRQPNTFTQGTRLLRDGNTAIIDKLFNNIIYTITIAFWNILTIVRNPPDPNILTIQMAILQKIQLPIGNPAFLIPNADLVANPAAIQQAIIATIQLNPAVIQQEIQAAIQVNPDSIKEKIKIQLRIQNIKIANISNSIRGSVGGTPTNIYSSIISGIDTIDQGIRDAAAIHFDVTTKINLAIGQVPLFDPNENGITNDDKIARSLNALGYFFEKISKDLFIVIESIIYSTIYNPAQMGFCTNDISNYNMASVLYKIIRVCNMGAMPNVSLELRCDKTKIISSLNDPNVIQNVTSLSKGLEIIRKKTIEQRIKQMSSKPIVEIKSFLRKNTSIVARAYARYKHGGKGLDFGVFGFDVNKFEREAKIRGDKIKKEKEDEKKRKEQIQKRIEEDEKKRQAPNKEKEEIIINQKFDELLHNASLIITILLRTDKYRDVIGNKLLPKYESYNFVFDEYSDEPWNFDAFSEKVNNLYIDYFGKYNLNIHVDENDIIDGLNNEFKDSSEKKEFIEEIEYASEEEDFKEEDENYLTELYNLPIESYDLLQMLRQFNDANNVFFDSLKILLPELLPEIFSDSSKIKKDELLNLCLRAYVYKTTNIDNISQDVKDENEAQIETIRQVYCPLASIDANIEQSISPIKLKNKSIKAGLTIDEISDQAGFFNKAIGEYSQNFGQGIRTGGKRKTRRNKPKKTRKKFQKRSKRFQKKSRKA